MAFTGPADIAPLQQQQKQGGLRARGLRSCGSAWLDQTLGGGAAGMRDHTSSAPLQPYEDRSPWNKVMVEMIEDGGTSRVSTFF